MERSKLTLFSLEPRRSTSGKNKLEKHYPRTLPRTRRALICGRVDCFGQAARRALLSASRSMMIKTSQSERESRSNLQTTSASAFRS